MHKGRSHARWIWEVTGPDPVGLSRDGKEFGFYLFRAFIHASGEYTRPSTYQECIRN